MKSPSERLNNACLIHPAWVSLHVAPVAARMSNSLILALIA